MLLIKLIIKGEVLNEKGLKDLDQYRRLNLSYNDNNSFQIKGGIIF